MPSDFRPSLPPANRYDMETSFGVQPIEEIQAELQESSDEWARGAALYGSFGLGEHVRKKVLALALLRIRNDYLNRGEKAPTEKVLDAMAHGDKDYVRWLDQQIIERANWLKLDDTRDQLRERIRRDDALIRSARAFA